MNLQLHKLILDRQFPKVLNDDTDNRKRRQLNKYSEYPDDCGAWQQGNNSTKTNVFIKSGETLRSVVSRGDMYSKISRHTFVPLNPQYDPTSVATVKRKYSVLGRNSNYKKRITWFDCEPEITTAVVEYIGEYTNNGVHGNVKATTAPYRQLTSQQKDISRQGLQHGKAPREVRRDVNLETLDDIIDHRITQNAKYNNDKKSRPANIPRQIIVDDILSVLSMFPNSNFIKEVITTSHRKPPSITLYTDVQMSLLKNAIGTGHVIFIDRIFNIRSCFLTPLCFQNRNLTSRNMYVFPVMLGPMLLYWDGNFDSYYKCTSHLQAKLVDTDQSNFIFESDEESADNLRKNLPQPELTTNLDRLFGADCILSSTDELTFNEIGSEMTDRYDIPYLKKQTISECATTCF